MFGNFKLNGVAALQRVREERPDQYLRVIASILPCDLNININNLDEISDQLLIERICQLGETIRPFIAVAS